MTALARLIALIDRLNGAVGAGVAWLSLAMVAITLVAVASHHVTWFRADGAMELAVWLNGALFMLGAGAGLLRDRHVRVDVFYRTASRRRRAWVDLLGVLFLLWPMMAVVAWYAWPFVVSSWQQGEMSGRGGTLPGLYLVKTLILVFCGLVALQGLSLAGRSLMVLTGREDRP